MWRYSRVVLPLIAFSALSLAQSVISAHSGVVHYIEGDVSIDNQPIHPKFAQFPEVKPDQVISADEGRAELLLTPGVFLRLAENSSVRMVSNSLVDTRLAMVSGSVLVEVGELLPGNTISFEAAGARIELPHKGLYRIDADPARIRVYDGQAQVNRETSKILARKGRQVALDSDALATSNFDVKDTDSFYRWSARRAEYVAEANVASARVAANPDSSYYSNGYYGAGYTGIGAGRYGAWSWNPWFGMFTYLPAYGTYFSPFGSYFYSPIVATTLYIPRSGIAATGLPARPLPAPGTLGRGIGGGSPRSLGGVHSMSGGHSMAAGHSMSAGHGR
jgi:hypothetical protein